MKLAEVLRNVRAPLRRERRERKRLADQAEINEIEWQIEREIEDIVGRGRTLVLGPWLSEVGYETLYWIPFLQWLKGAFRLEADRLVAVSRGGVAGWYADVASRYVEIWDAMEPAEFARRNAERGVTKQYEPSALDEAILDAVAGRLGTREFDVIHPGLMYRLFTLYWSGKRPMGFMDAYLRFTRMTAPRIIDPSLLPDRYVAVKFYAARSLPDTPAMRGQLRAMIAALAAQAPVVLLDTGLVLEDDHADYAFAAGGQVISARPWMTPATNLGVQTQIIAGASGFVGTCGSLAWLAPFLGIPTVAVYDTDHLLAPHLLVARQAGARVGAAEFSPLDLRAVARLGLEGVGSA